MSTWRSSSGFGFLGSLNILNETWSLYIIYIYTHIYIYIYRLGIGFPIEEQVLPNSVHHLRSTSSESGSEEAETRVSRGSMPSALPVSSELPYFFCDRNQMLISRPAQEDHENSKPLFLNSSMMKDVWYLNKIEKRLGPGKSIDLDRFS